VSNNPNQPQQPPSTPPESFWTKVRNWLVFIVLIIVVLWSAGSWVYSFFDSFHDPDNASDTVNQYYTAIEQQDYATAYTYLTADIKIDSGPNYGRYVTQPVFIQQGKDADAAQGKVKSYSIKNVLPGVNSDGWGVRVKVTRNGAPYDVNVGVRKTPGGFWRIFAFDSI
jgi:hypothetical protein